jgi:hypothetical protein
MGPEIETFLGPEMATSAASAIWARKFCLSVCPLPLIHLSSTQPWYLSTTWPWSALIPLSTRYWFIHLLALIPTVFNPALSPLSTTCPDPAVFLFLISLSTRPDPSVYCRPWSLSTSWLSSLYLPGPDTGSWSLCLLALIPLSTRSWSLYLLTLIPLSTARPWSLSLPPGPDPWSLLFYSVLTPLILPCVYYLARISWRRGVEMQWKRSITCQTETPTQCHTFTSVSRKKGGNAISYTVGRVSRDEYIIFAEGL